MTQEDKQLLLKDLCARLPYGVLISYKDEIRPLFGIEPTQRKVITLDNEINGNHNGLEYCLIEEIKPYLRPMSSMTEEEIAKYCELLNPYEEGDETFAFYEAQDFLNSIHVDYRGLISKGLALPAPEGMYNI